MNPDLADVVDWHGRRHGAPAELVAIHGPDRSSVITESFDTASLGHIPASHLTLAGQMGGALIERCDTAVTITVALASGTVFRWQGPPGRLAPSATLDTDPAVVTWLWSLLYPASGRGCAPTGSEIAGRVLLDTILTDAIERDWHEPVTPALEALHAGDLLELARLAGAPRPHGAISGTYIRQLMAHLEWRRIPLPTGNPATSLAALHRRAPYRWQLAIDLRDVLGDVESARTLLWAPTHWLSPQN